ncbi:hypothetical protein A8139_17465 [Marinomonas primoryensis]|uniref:Uncharacterized protein n=1 Tax=Marinomonas primoryensis TaxID=178399 RepID=A0A2Z4PWL4_9GAMM|nr:hypothetical protein [Marinomonas primoryensis]AWY01549.1 hypothetical protein A8139_17465 [Marinomonas primoryensis]
MSDLQTLSDEAIASMNDIYVMLSEDNIAYLPYDFYADESRIIEKVNVDGTFAKRFFLNEEGVYPANLAGPAVTKVIPWNLEQAAINSGNNTKSTYQPGYFIDLRQLKMSRLNMIQISDDSSAMADTPIPNSALPVATNTFIPVPKDQQNQLKAVPKNANLYVAFFQKPDDTRSSSECYSYCVSYISAEEVNQHLVVPKTPPTHQDISIEHLKTYYGDAQVQAGAINPKDLRSDSTTKHDIQSSAIGAMPITCYIANLRTFKP